MRLFADADLDAREILAAEMVDDVFQPVLAACRALRAHAQCTHVERNIVRQHNDPFGRDLVKRRCSVHRLAGQVHEGLRLEEEHALAAQHPLAHERLELHPVDLLPGARTVAFQRAEARIVPGVIVLAAGIAQPDDQPLGRLRRLCSLLLVQLFENIEY